MAYLALKQTPRITCRHMCGFSKFTCLSAISENKRALYTMKEPPLGSFLDHYPLISDPITGSSIANKCVQ
jgi:hypothetical protein